ncbi:MAG: phenylalanine--tRNA ligase subunit alpha [Acidobacteriota bacterium]
MIEQLNTLRDECLGAIEAAGSDEELETIHASFLGRSGELTKLMKGLKDVPKEQKKEVGQTANRVKQELSAALQARQVALVDAASSLPVGFDPTVPGTGAAGGLHPITQITLDLNDAFATLGFEVYEGPEISSELFAFDNLNFPPDHPARETMDTYWLEGRENERGAERLCLRPHLTGGSVRYMQERKPPYRFVYPGRVYRNESTDRSHERAFFQYEALIVDKAVPFSAGQLLVKTILRTVFGRDVPTRMRSGFFPFVEPGFEIDMQCLNCGGAGCSVCKQVGWLEVMPGGPPHPNVLKAAGVDPDEWEGFYINVGLDRMVMMRTGVDDVRLFHSGDLRFLGQFE